MNKERDFSYAHLTHPFRRFGGLVKKMMPPRWSESAAGNRFNRIFAGEDIGAPAVKYSQLR